ncbi:NEL-type E3 ubiquitin ligase domain-containing protein [Pseudomonas sp. SK2]|uniref:NEL-type E3 ubiquitin ligase domain-containing protein n=1 Tax=Pseudomonas sp. SK2 TaxID=2841063 RepID=UPI00192C1C87|nr:NEL-type E3 ubiquitin ligase domain-containing protein [Pseudomonas sp. SK2]QQZ37989.1 hypothetical protein IF103_08740 [Pseudomonas sp. SK2]
MIETTQDMPRERATDAFIAQLLPQWLRSSTYAQVQILRTCFEHHVQSQHKVQVALAGLEPLDTFVTQRLQEKLQSSFSLTVELGKAQWREERRKLVADASGPILHEAYFVRSPAVLKLMQNFKQGESFFEHTALVYPADPATGQAERVLTTDSEQLVDICRTLDVGRQYQQHLDSVLDTDYRAALAEDKRTQLRLAVELASLKRQLPTDEVNMLRRFAAGQPLTHPHSHRVRAGALEVLGCRVDGALAFELQRLNPAFRDVPPFIIEGVILYLPGDPECPLRAFGSWQQASWALGALLRDAAYRQAFVQRIAMADRAAYLSTLNKRLADDQTDASCACGAIDEQIFKVLAEQQLQRIRDNARFLAVPTAQVDARVSAEHLRTLESVGIGLVSLAGLFVPVIGAVLVTHWVGQILSEVFEGVEDWKQGHQHEALEHLLGVVESVAIGTALAAGTTLAARGFLRSANVDQMVPVLDGEGRARLWSAEIGHYEDPSPPDDLLEQDNGLLSNALGQWWYNDNKYFQVVPVPGRSSWRLRHPRRESGFGPELAFNGERGWRLSSERPLEWEGAPLLLGRLWPPATRLDPERIGQILKVADVDQDHLRGLLVEGRALPVALRDTLERFAVDARVDEFLEQLDRGLNVDPELFQWCVEHFGLEEGLTSQEQRVALIEEGAAVHEQLFDHFSRKYLAMDPLLDLVSRDFKGLPDAYALDVLRQATDTQRRWMRSEQRIPLPVAERARAHLQLARLTRAREGLYLKGSYHPDTVALAFALLRKHARLSTTVDIELREGSDVGRPLARLHPQNDPLRISTVLVRQAGGFKCYDLQGRELSVDQVDPVEIGEVLARYLSRDDLARLGWDGSQASEQINNALRAWLPADNKALVELLGAREIKPTRNSLRRLPDGRMGYPLNGHDEARHPSRRLLLESLGALYPTHSAQALEDYVATLLESPQTAYAVMIRQYQQYLALDRAMQTWVMQVPAGRQRGARRFASEELRRSWRLGGPQDSVSSTTAPASRLTLVGLDIGGLPALPANTDFAHITDLVLVGLQLEHVPPSFLGSFSRLRGLNLSNNALTSLPAGIGGVSQLRILHLARNRIRMTEEGAQALSGLTQLDTLDLGFNRLGSISLRLGQLTRLRELNLRRNNLHSVPTALEQCLHLEAADLRDNQIAQLPDTLLLAPLHVRLAIRLENNALPVAERERLYAANPVQVEPPGPTEAPGLARSAWLQLADSATRTARSLQWDDLLDEPDSDAFFRVLAELTQTSDFQHVPQDLSRRVWAMIAAASENAALRAELFELAAVRTCVDQVISCFSTLEVRVLLAEAMQSAAAGGQEQALLELACGLFRLDRVAMIAGKEVERRVTLEVDRLRTSGWPEEQSREFALAQVDAIEISLAYRVGLARTLNLPGQPKTMQFEQLAGVSPMQLSNAAAEVRWASATDALLNDISQRDFWIAHLERQYATEFQQVKQPFWEQLEEEGTEDAERVAHIQRAFDDAVHRLVLRLSAEALSVQDPAN